MEKTIIQIYLDGKLPTQYAAPEKQTNEEAVKDVEELCSLYKAKYGSFGEVVFHVYRENEKEGFINGLNTLFQEKDIDIKVDEVLLQQNLGKFVPLIVVDGEIVSRGTYPELTAMRGGENSVNRGGTGAHGEH